MLRSSLSLGLSLAASVASPDASAQEPELTDSRRASSRTPHILFDDLVGLRTGSGSFGDPSGLSQSGVVSYVTTSSAGSRSTSWSISPALDVPVGDRITLGGRLRAGRTHARSEGTPGPPLETEGWSWSVLPRVGYLVPLNDSLSLWPRLGLGYGRTDHKFGGAGVGGLGIAATPALAPLGASHQWTATLDLSLTARLLDYLLVAVGPEASLNFVGADSGASSAILRLGGRASMGMVF